MLPDVRLSPAEHYDKAVALIADPRPPTEAMCLHAIAHALLGLLRERMGA